ncbi:MAG: CopD family protein [Myxococcota bacterium]
MRELYLVSVWLHILAAATWAGGMSFVALVVVPWLRSGGRGNAGAFLRETGLRFRAVGWVCFGVVLVTGTFNLWMRGVRLGNLVDPAWLSSPFGLSVAAKLAVFALVVGLSAVHDFNIGPRAAEAMERDPAGPGTERLRRQASIFGRVNGLLALVLIAIAVTIVRGW